MEPNVEPIKTFMEEHTKRRRRQNSFLYTMINQWLGPLHGYHYQLSEDKGQPRIQVVEVGLLLSLSYCLTKKSKSCQKEHSAVFHA